MAVETLPYVSALLMINQLQCVKVQILTKSSSTRRGALISILQEVLTPIARSNRLLARTVLNNIEINVYNAPNACRYHVFATKKVCTAVNNGVAADCRNSFRLSLQTN